MSFNSANGHGGFQDPGFGDGDFGFDLGGFGQNLAQMAFIQLVDAVIAAPPQPFIAAGDNAASGTAANLYWTYVPHVGLTLETKAGFLTTQTGNGGFDLFVGTNGQWVLKFDGSSTVISSNENSPVPPPPASNTVLDVPGTGASSVNGSAGDLTVNGGAGWDTVQGGVGDYMIGGSGTLGGGLAGDGNCALYSASPGSVLVDMQNGRGYGGTAEGDVYVNMNQVRGSLYSNVLIGSSSGTDLKSGGNDSVLISTGGSGHELRPDGSGDVLVSTVGADRVLFDPTHGWQLGDTGNIVLGFNAAHGDSLDLSLLLGGGPIKETNGQTVTSNFFTTSAAGYNPATGTGDINDYVRIIDGAGGSQVMFSATGNEATAGVALVDLALVHGLSVTTMYQNHAIIA